MASEIQLIESTAGDATAELQRRGLAPDERVVLTVLPALDLIPGRREARARVLAAGLSDDDIDRLIKEAQAQVRAEAAHG